MDSRPFRAIRAPLSHSTVQNPALSVSEGDSTVQLRDVIVPGCVNQPDQQLIDANMY